MNALTPQPCKIRSQHHVPDNWLKLETSRASRKWAVCKCCGAFIGYITAEAKGKK
jgi:hypothetical protein